MRSFSIEPKYGLKALDQLQDFIFCCVRNEFEVPEFIIECYSSIDNFCGIAFRAMKGVGLGPGEGGRGCRLKRFMNRLFGLSLQLQTHIFDLFLYLVSFDSEIRKLIRDIAHVAFNSLVQELPLRKLPTNTLRCDAWHIE